MTDLRTVARWIVGVAALAVASAAVGVIVATAEILRRIVT